MLKKRIALIPSQSVYDKKDKPQTNDDLVEAKIFTYGLQVENTMATMVRNGLLSIRIAFLFYMSPQVSPWVGKLMIFTGATIIIWSIVTYTKNLTEIRHLLNYSNENLNWNAYVWPILCSLLGICIYCAFFELL